MSRFCTRGEILLNLMVLILLAVAALLVPSTLRADTVTYNLSSSDTLSDGGAISGTFTADLVTKHVTGTILAEGLTFTASSAALSCFGGCSNDVGFVASAPGGKFIVFAWPINPVEFPSTITFDAAQSYCMGCITGALDYLARNDTASNVPEPSSLLLLGTGLFGLVPLLRRRLSSDL